MENFITYGSVCSGIEAASIAWEPLGWQAAWFAEIEDFPSAVLKHHWPHVPNLGDMCGIAADIRAEIVEAPDVLVGGTPCQSFSMAGLRKGISDERGKLTLAFVELADEIDRQRIADGKPACVIVWENVPGVLTSEDNAFGCFLAGLAGDDEYLEPGPCPERNRSSAFWTWKEKTGVHCPKWPNAGYIVGASRTIAWRVIDAQFFGLAQRRRRVIVVASARDGFDPGEILFEFEGVRRDSAPSRETRQAVAGAASESITGGGSEGSDRELNRLKAYRMVAFGEYADDDSASTIKARDFKDATDLVTIPIHDKATRHSGGGNDRKNDGSANGLGIGDVNDPMPTLDTHCRHAVAICAEPIPILEAGARTGKSTTDIRAGSGIGESGDPMFTLQASKQHAICVHGTQHPIVQEECAHTLGRNSGQENAVCISGEITHTLKAEGYDASEDGTGRGQPIVHAFQPRIARNGRGDMGEVVNALTAQAGETGKGDAAPCVAVDMAVRRLTPVECERLQGTPDNHTNILISGKPTADGPRYKAIGNSMATHCMFWVGARIDIAIRNAHDRHQ